MSQFLGPRELSALERIGDLMLPGDSEFPSFSQTGCIAFIDDLLCFMNPKDRDDLKNLLRVLSFLPSPLLRAFLRLCQTHRTPTLRMVELGLKGLVMSLYYSNKTDPRYRGRTSHDVIGFALRRL
ncbi:MAG: hypothetical protein NZ930_03655 [Candidatus Bipolaricaulota bacterium]|nr:hypothetical protein [Candidatus Bipolaricaulota bacterium]MDW8031454.1 hypothetical protein [Candidatus Bipolaricaulota bacterium]